MLVGSRLKDAAEGTAPTTRSSARRLYLFLLRSGCVEDVGHRATTTGSASTVVVVFAVARSAVVLFEVTRQVPGMLLGNVFLYGSKVLFNLSACQ